MVLFVTLPSSLHWRYLQIIRKYGQTFIRPTVKTVLFSLLLLYTNPTIFIYSCNKFIKRTVPVFDAFAINPHTPVAQKIADQR